METRELLSHLDNQSRISVGLENFSKFSVSCKKSLVFRISTESLMTSSIQIHTWSLLAVLPPAHIVMCLHARANSASEEWHSLWTERIWKDSEIKAVTWSTVCDDREQEYLRSVFAECYQLHQDKNDCLECSHWLLWLVPDGWNEPWFPILVHHRSGNLYHLTCICVTA